MKPSAPPKSDQPRVLVVDDNEAIRRSVGALLRHKGFEASFSLNGRQATESIVRGGYEFVVTDLDMPEMNGLELLMWIQEHRPALPVVVMSGTLPTDRPTLTLIRNTAAAVLVKPFTGRELSAAIEKVANAAKH